MSTASCSARRLRGGKCEEEREFSADDANGVQEGEAIRILVGFEGRFMHDAADGEVRHHQAEELLLHQVGVLLRKTMSAPRRWVFISSSAVSISQRS